MAAGTQFQGTVDPESEPRETPPISICESRPGKSVFIESGNTDGWIASDTTAAVNR